MTRTVTNPSPGVIPPEDIARMTTTTAQINIGDSEVPSPPWAGFVDTWDSGLSGGRVILGVDHTITGCDVHVSTSCVQHIDGHIDDGSTDEGPQVYIDRSVNLNSDQARELAGLRLELATQIDGWVAR